MILDESLPGTLRALRSERGLSLGEAAHRAGVSVNSLRGWESGRQVPKGKTLSRTLEALNAPERTRARLLAEADPRQARIMLTENALGPPLSVGTVLRAMRARRGVTQVDLARALGVTQGTVAKWETGASTPSATTLHEASFTLGAEVEETIALASALGTAPETLPDEPALVSLPDGLPLGLREALALAYEADLWRKAARDPRWEPALCAVLGWRANLYAMEGRFSEIPMLAERAMRLAVTTEAKTAAVPAVNALTEAFLERGESPERSARICGTWAETLPDSKFKAWMIGSQALNVARVGRGKEGIDLMSRARDIDEEEVASWHGELHARHSRAQNIAATALEAGMAVAAEKALQPFWGFDGDRLLYARVQQANGRALGKEGLRSLRDWVVGRIEGHHWKNLVLLEKVERVEAKLVGKRDRAGFTSLD